MSATPTAPGDLLPGPSLLAKLRWFVRSMAGLNREQRIRVVATLFYELVSFPATVLAFFVNRRIHPGYGLTWRKRIWLALRIYTNSYRVLSLISYKAQLMMAVKLFEIPPEVEGVVVECGCFLGGASTNLSLVCAMTGRQLILYDSFEGLPSPVEGEKVGRADDTGGLRGTLDTVRANIARTGNLEVCTFRKGWFADTLPLHREPIVMMFLDVDYQASLHDCVLNLWPHLVLNGFLFLDEYVLLDYCALFFSERYWREYFGERPPGLLGAGTGVGMGYYYWGPWLQAPLFQQDRSIAYTFKGNSGFWDFYPEDLASEGARTAADGSGAAAPR